MIILKRCAMSDAESLFSRRTFLIDAALVSLPASVATALASDPVDNLKDGDKTVSSRLRIDYGSYLNLFDADAELCRDAFERYLEMCENEIATGRQDPFFIKHKNMERLLNQLNENDPLMGNYRRPDPVERDSAIEANRKAWKATSDRPPLMENDEWI
jgi:hypothetical protein